LDAIETVHVENKISSKYSTQFFDYILVLDFEATCWDRKDKDKAPPEIIEFPCVLYDIKQREIVSEFQQYVMPTENQKLSSFCTQLTGNIKKPKGLHGALLELGLNFEGQQHCGLHDARNTAKLIGRMVTDGVSLRTTKDISIKFL
ncbi:hypothetical protein NQ314_005926, partial [Rhamnusium bicolor]